MMNAILYTYQLMTCPWSTRSTGNQVRGWSSAGSSSSEAFSPVRKLNGQHKQQEKLSPQTCSCVSLRSCVQTIISLQHSVLAQDILKYRRMDVFCCDNVIVPVEGQEAVSCHSVGGGGSDHHISTA